MNVQSSNPLCQVSFFLCIVYSYSYVFIWHLCLNHIYKYLKGWNLLLPLLVLHALLGAKTLKLRDFHPRCLPRNPGHWDGVRSYGWCISGVYKEHCKWFLEPSTGGKKKVPTSIAVTKPLTLSRVRILSALGLGRHSATEDALSLQIRRLYLDGASGRGFSMPLLAANWWLPEEFPAGYRVSKLRAPNTVPKPSLR
jgi:hypothetical protein